MFKGLPLLLSVVLVVCAANSASAQTTPATTSSTSTSSTSWLSGGSVQITTGSTTAISQAIDQGVSSLLLTFTNTVSSMVLLYGFVLFLGVSYGYVKPGAIVHVVWGASIIFIGNVAAQGIASFILTSATSSSSS